MLVMLVYSILLLGIIVNASDAPRISAVGEDQFLGSDNLEQTVNNGRDLNSVRVVDYIPLGFSTPVTHPAVSVLDILDEALRGSRDIVQGIYHEAWSLCIDSLWNTCVGRCGQSLYGAPYVCSCDILCPAYGDCCLDYELECTWDGPIYNASSQSIYFENLGKMVCVSLAQDYDYGVLVVTECADWWPKGNSELFERSNAVRQNCENPSPVTFKPIEAEFGLTFKNVWCYICNNLQNRNREQEPPQEPSSSVALPFTCNPTNSSEATYSDLCHIEINENVMRHSTYRVCAYDVNECPDASNATTTIPRHPTSTTSALVEDPFRATSNHSREVSASSNQSGTWSMDDGDATDKFNELCTAYSKPVFGTSLFGDTQSFKNVHCAHCHKQPTSRLFCPSWKLMPTSRNSDSSGPIIVFETGLSAENKYEIRDIPASFAILYHFGTDGGQNTMYSSQGQEWWEETLDNCDEDEIWDPFSELCRQIYCSAEFTLVDFQCVQIYTNGSDAGGDYDYDNVVPDNVTAAIQNVDLTEVLVILGIQLDSCVDEDSEEVLETQFVDALAASLNISASRFTNFTLYNVTAPVNETTEGCPRRTIVSLVLLGPNSASQDPDPSIEKVMASLSYGVALNHLLLHLEAGITVRVIGLREKVVHYTNGTGNSTDEWCADGRQLYYTTGQFTPVTRGNSVENVTLYIYVNVTGYTYLPGQFIANILFEGDQRSVLANVTGAVVVCDMSYHNNTCVRVMLSPDEYQPLPNGSIVYTGDENFTNVFNPGSYEIMSSGEALVCVTLPAVTNTTTQTSAAHLLDMKVQGLLTTVLLSLSSLAILLTILTYVFFAELRNLPGWNMLHLASCLLVYQLIYLSGMRPSVTSEPVICELVAISLHYTLMAYFFWMNVIAYDLYKTFGRKSLLAVATRETNLLPWYALYAYGMPLAIVGGCVAVDQLSIFPDTWVGYGKGQECWIGNPVALAAVFAAPTLLIILVNFTFYAVTVFSIRKIRLKTKLTTGLSSGKSQLLIYTRISTVMGFTWIFGNLCGIPELSYTLYDVFSYLFIVLNTSQGASIFFAFVCNKKILKLYRNCSFVVCLSACVDRLRRCRDCKELKCVCQKPIVRTISNETCQSIIMDEKLSS